MAATGPAMSRDTLVERLADAVDAVGRPHPVRVAVDGPDAARKTTPANELGEALLGATRDSRVGRRV